MKSGDARPLLYGFAAVIISVAAMDKYSRHNNNNNIAAVAVAGAVGYTIGLLASH